MKMETSQRLDSLARELAHGRSRRDLVRDALRMCLGGLLTFGVAHRTRAQQVGTVPLGGICTTDEQCATQIDLGPPPICAPTGLGGGAARQCCLDESGVCQD